MTIGEAIEGTGYATATIAAPAEAAISAAPVPEFFRLPSRGQDKYFGLTRPFYYLLLKEGRIKSVCLRRKGAARGIRLIFSASVREYLLKNME